MSNWTLTSPPSWVPNAVATDKGWENPDTGEVLVAIGELATNNAAGPAPVSYAWTNTSTYKKEGDTIGIAVTFNGIVTVTGTPTIEVTIGVNARSAAYVSGSGSNVLLFEYEVVAGDTGTITRTGNIVLSGGTIVETAQSGKLGVFTIGNAGSNYTGNLAVSFTGGTGSPKGGAGVGVIAAGSLDSIVLDDEGAGYTGAPTVVLTKPGSGAVLTPVVVGGEVVDILITDPGSGYTGAPTLSIADTGNGADATATCTIHDGGIATVTVTAPGTSYDDTTAVTVTKPGSNAAATVALKAVNATLVLATLGDATNGTVDNALANPTVTLLGGPRFETGEEIVLKFAFAEPMTTMGTPEVTLAINVTNVLAVLDPLRSEGNNLYFVYTVLGTDVCATAEFTIDDAGGVAIANGQYIKDAAGNDWAGTFTAPATTTVSVNTLKVDSVTIVDGGTGYHQATTTIEFAVPPAGGTRAEGTVTVDGGVITEVQVTVVGSGYVEVPAITVTDSDVAPGADADLLAVMESDLAAAPTITTVTDISGAKKLGDPILVSVNFDQKVSVSYVDLKPTVELTIGTGDPVFAEYYSGSGTQTLVFRYVVVAGDSGATVIGADAVVTQPNSRIQNSSGVNAVLTHVAPASTQTVDTTVPTIVGITRLLGPAYITGDNLDYEVEFSEAVNKTGTPRIAVGIGENTRYANYQAGHGTDTLTFRYTIQATDYAPIPGQGFALDNYIDLNGGTLKDVAGNAVANLQFRRPINTTITVNA